jgi:hypothetical protein
MPAVMRMPNAGSFPTIPGSTTNYSSTYGGKPLVPSPGATAGAAIGSNVGNLGALYQLGTGASDYGERQLISNYNMAIPDYTDLAKQSSQNISAELEGQMPGDVVTQILQSAAERGISTGTTGSPNFNAALLHALGLTSLDMTKLGETELSGAVQRSPIAQPFDISRMFITPEQEQEAAMAANLYQSAPVPADAARALQAQAGGGGSGADQLPWWMSAGERRSLMGGAHYDAGTGSWMGY